MSYDSSVDLNSIAQVLFIDGHDSFARNIVDLLESTLPVVVTVVSIDAIWPVDKQALADEYDAIITGPGPGTPTNPNDVGCMLHVWDLENVPVLGICLGFQSLCVQYGASICKLPEPRHGRVVTFVHSGTDIFETLPASFEVTLYHSLQVRLDHEIESSGDLSDRQRCWLPSPKCPDLVPLAWYRDSATPGEATLMAVRHSKKPLWGLQFHPESCKSDKACRDIIRNWWLFTENFNAKHRTISRRRLDLFDPLRVEERYFNDANDIVEWCSSSTDVSAYRTINRGSLTTEKICELVDVPNVPSVVIDSTSRFSIISVLSPGAWTLEYSISKLTSTISRPSGLRSTKDLAPRQPKHVWDMLRRILSKKKVVEGNKTVPFWGGFMGYFSYEMGLAELHDGEAPVVKKDDTVDVGLLWVERSIVIDRKLEKIHIQSIREFDDQPGEWIDFVARRLTGFTYTKSMDNIMLNIAVTSPEPLEETNYLMRLKYSDEQLANMMVREANIVIPDEDIYKSKIKICQEYIRDGESYELCLTDQTKVTLPRCEYRQESDLRPWILYKRLRKYTPAAYGAFARIGKTKIISSSPECFIQYDRYGQIDMKPMKGTVKKSEGMTLEKAKEILNTPKEMGENLMIADLIRHDMFKVCKSGGVTVHKLLEVEDHPRVYQLVSHIRGVPEDLPPSLKERCKVQLVKKASPHDYSALRQCLPPGSMTGAPKRQSCELLAKIEGQKRRIYSGVMGYFDAGGAACFSVLIRTAYSQSSATDDEEVWHIGAGGAVTALSTPEGEWDEMVTKLDTVLGIFRRSPDGDGVADADADTCKKKTSVMQEMFQDYPGYTTDFKEAVGGRCYNITTEKGDGRSTFVSESVLMPVDQRGKLKKKQARKLGRSSK
ncbi:aminodeoxychorismate synthase [Paracoccidioides brasiliensis Pb18]|uniref:aminodeoxychorismate synthase n=1 Tax=Paracoccidioides brasiliensis (strain Pb18) TaxID=502780 RepID=C1GG48_PARBD|nr:aminodeoxychorismate synthase [Paracoccidioides brasiliensis Pb18]EEH50206.1 aminodeoxychorismate synthase [Paracoccidioides brasiliensis Pb18]